MGGQVSVIEDSSLLSRLDVGLLKIEKACALISGLAIFSLMFLAAYSVTGRKFFNSPLAGYVDYIEAAMPIIAIMGVSYVQRDGSHIRMDLFVSLLKGRSLWMFELISVILIFILIRLLHGVPGYTSIDLLIAHARFAVGIAQLILGYQFGHQNWLFRLLFQY